MSHARLSLVVAAVAAVVLWPAVAVAHVGIVVVIRSPTDGQDVGGDLSIDVAAQPALAGVDHATFTAELDGRPVDPASGRITTESVPAVIRVGATTRISLRGLVLGEHRFLIRYRADTDEPATQTAVSFVVVPSNGTRRWLIATSGAALLAVGAGGVWLMRRHRAPPDTPSP